MKVVVTRVINYCIDNNTDLVNPKAAELLINGIIHLQFLKLSIIIFRDIVV